MPLVLVRFLSGSENLTANCLTKDLYVHCNLTKEREAGRKDFIFNLIHLVIAALAIFKPAANSDSQVLLQKIL